MKIRHGFVSNSSSTSFCIMGAYVETSKDILEEQGFGDCYELEGNDFVVYQRPEFDYGETEFYIGIPIKRMKDTQTREDFRQEVIERFNIEFPFLKVKDDVDILYDGWYNG